MAQRKAQFIVNFMQFNLKIPRERHSQYLFGMSDEAFERIEHEYRNYIISQIHDPSKWQGELKPVGKMLHDDQRGKKSKTKIKKKMKQ